MPSSSAMKGHETARPANLVETVNLFMLIEAYEVSRSYRIE